MSFLSPSGEQDNLLIFFCIYRSDFIYDLVEHLKPSPGANSKSAKKRPTVSSQFRVSIQYCLKFLIILQMELFFASPCVVPNGDKVCSILCFI